MTNTPAWRRYLTFWRSSVSQDVDEELTLHVRLRVHELVARGMSEDDARRAVVARLGDLDAARRECIELGHARERQARNAGIVEAFRSDIRYAFRSLRRAPAWTSVALLTIGLGVGASAAVMSVADALLLRPVGYPSALRVMTVRRELTMGDARVYGPISPETVDAWRRGAHTIETLSALFARSVEWGDPNEDVRLNGAWVDTGFFSFAGVHALIGRTFSPEERVANGRPAIILSETLWRREFGSSNDILGRIVQVDGASHVIVGVAPASLSLPDVNASTPDLWLPLVAGAQKIQTVVVRARAGESAPSVEKDLDRVASNADAGALPAGSTAAIRVNRPGDTLRFRSALLMLSGAVALLFLVACSNVANLLLARSAVRRVELAVRQALGAHRSRLVRQLVTESLVVSLFGAALAVAVGWLALRLIGRVHPPKLVALSRVAPGFTIVGIVAALAIATGVVVGMLVGARVSGGHDLSEALRTGSQGSQRGGARLRGALVVGELALSSTLLVGALLLVRGVISLQRTDLGFDARDLFGVTFSARGPELQSIAQRRAFIAELRSRARAVPGLVGATVAVAPPHRVPYFIGVPETPDRPAEANAPNIAGPSNGVDADYFSALGIRFLAGRTFDPGALGRNEVIVSATLARSLWPGATPTAVLGRRFRFANSPTDTPDPWNVVVGVTADAVSGDLLQDRGEPAMFTPLGQENRISLVARVNDRRAMESLRALGKAMHPSSPPSVSSVEQGFADALAVPKFTMAVLATFAALGIVLAAIGLYGVIAYTVAQRTREIGIRMTLGATRGTIAGMVVQDGLRLALLGIALGIVGAATGSRVLENSLYGVPRADPLAFGAGVILVLIISVLACVVPMLRATAVDPVLAVRAE
jgi:predicted permease